MQLKIVLSSVAMIPNASLYTCLKVAVVRQSFLIDIVFNSFNVSTSTTHTHNIHDICLHPLDQTLVIKRNITYSFLMLLKLSTVKRAFSYELKDIRHAILLT